MVGSNRDRPPPNKMKKVLENEGGPQSSNFSAYFLVTFIPKTPGAHPLPELTDNRFQFSSQLSH